ANYFGALLAVPTAAGVGLARAERRLLWLVPSAVCLAAIVQTHSRGAALATVAGAVLVMLANPLADAVVSGRNAEQLHVNNRVRLDAAQLALVEAVRHPVAGIGYGEFPAVAAADP